MADIPPLAGMIGTCVHPGMDAPNQAPLDYYILPSLDIQSARLRIKEDNGIFLDGYRFESLDYFYGIAQTVRAGAAS